MTIRVIGAGFGRTGTSSLQAALEQLGFGTCYHMRTLFTQPEHAQVWLDACAGLPVNWNALFEGFQATVDWPGTTFYKELMRVYPDAKVLLSVRDPESWYTSVANTIYQARQAVRQQHGQQPGRQLFGQMIEKVVWCGTFHDRFEDKAYIIDIFNRHNDEVQRSVPPERLLVYNVRQGWGPLCRFLGVPEPEGVPFPHLNDTAEFHRVIVQNTLRAAPVASVGD